MMRQAIGVLAIAIGLIYLLVQFGVPLLIKMALFIGNFGNKECGSVTKESSILVPPTLQPLPEATYSARLDISGFAQEDVTVALFVNGSEVDEMAVDSDGEFEFDKVKLRLGKNRIWGVTRDDSDNQSRESDEILLVMDDDPPRITVDSPEGDTQVSEDSIVIEGMIDEEANISINDQFVMQKSDNGFYKTINLSEGDNELKIKAIDMAGNETETVLKVKYLK